MDVFTSVTLMNGPRVIGRIWSRVDLEGGEQREIKGLLTEWTPPPPMEVEGSE